MPGSDVGMAGAWFFSEESSSIEKTNLPKRLAVLLIDDFLLIQLATADGTASRLNIMIFSVENNVGD